jgi:type I restriction enzyme, S subunit
MQFEAPVIRLDNVAQVNPPRRVVKGAEIPFVEMAALPVRARDIDPVNVSIRAAKGAGAHFQNGDTLLARITPCLENGKTAQVRRLHVGQVGEGSTEFIVLSGVDAADNDFIYYMCRDPAFREYAIGRMEGTSGRQRVTWQAVSAYQFSCPPPDVRRSAARLLAELDDRIELLRQTNATLEAIAQGLFKSCFIDFDPVRAKAEGREPEGMDAATAALFPAEFEQSIQGLIPRGWRVGALADAVQLNPSSALSKGIEARYLEMANAPTNGHRPLERVGLRAFGSGCKFRNGDALLAKITPCLENGKSAFVDFLDDHEVGWGSTEFIVLRSKPVLPDYGAYLLARHEPFRQFAIQAMTGTSGRQRVELSRLAQFPMALPPDSSIAEALEPTLRALQSRIAGNDEQAKDLADLRDTLLPRLISGELRLPEAQEQVAEVIA